jgi:hypothetical protein
MITNRFVCVALIVVLLFGSLPTLTFADEKSNGASQMVDLRAAIERAAATQVNGPRALAMTSSHETAASRARQGAMGGGGGAGAIIWMLVGTAAGLAGTYYVVKEMRKQTDELARQ